MPVLHGNGKHNDRPAIWALFNGFKAYDCRTGDEITAPTMKHLPPGLYWVAPDHPKPEKLLWIN